MPTFDGCCSAVADLRPRADPVEGEFYHRGADPLPAAEDAHRSGEYVYAVAIALWTNSSEDMLLRMYATAHATSM